MIRSVCIVVLAAGFAVRALAQAAPVPVPEIEDPDSVLASINLPPEPWVGTNGAPVRPGVGRAQALIRAAGEQGTNTPAIFVALTEAADLASRAGDGGLAATSLETLGRYFIVPDLPLRMQEALALASRNAGGRSDAVASLADGHLRLATQWIAATNFAAAEAAVRSAQALSLRARDAALTAAVADAARRVTEARQLHAARAALRTNPTDAAACLLVGRHLCLREQNWAEGLRLLARGSNGNLALAARTDLDALQRGAPEAVRAAADGWWNAAQQEREKADKAALHVRAAQLYQLVLAKLSETERKRVTQRIALVTENNTKPLPPLATTDPAAASAAVAAGLPDIPPPTAGMRRPMPEVADRAAVVAALRPAGSTNATPTAREWLIRAAAAITNDAQFYVALTEAAAAGLRAGDGPAITAAFDPLEAHFDIEGLGVRRLEALRAAERAAGTRPDALTGILDSYLRAALTSLSRDRVRDAEAALAAATPLLNRSRDKTLAEAAAWVGRKVRLARQEMDLSAALDRNEADQAANFALGSLCCFERRDWTAGLPFLARSGHRVLQPVAQRDLTAAKSENVADARTAADAWWDVATGEKEKEVRAAMRMHAAVLYERALGKVSETERRRIVPRIQSARESDTRRLAPERAPELKRLMAWANRLPDVALTIAVSNRLDLPQGAPIKTLEPLSEWSIESLFADATRISSLEPLRNLPISTLSISSTLVSDLTPVRTLRLKNLNVVNTPVTDLAPLAGLELEGVAVALCAVTNLAPLRGMPVRHLNLHGIPVSNDVLEVVAELPVEELYLGGTYITTLEPLKDLRLKALGLDSTAISDLRPLIGMPLAILSIKGCTNIQDFSPFARFVMLKTLAVDGIGPDLRDALSKIKVETINGQPAATVLGEAAAAKH